MALVADSGAIYALYDQHDQHHQAVRAVVAEELGAIWIPTVILAEVGDLLGTRLGVRAERRFLEGFLQQAFTLYPFTLEDAAACKNLLARYAHLDLSLADAAVLVAAERTEARRILTVNTRDYQAVRTQHGEPFELVP